MAVDGGIAPRIQLADHVLLADAARGCVASLAVLYDRYASLLLAVAQRILRDPTAAEDLVYDVFIEAWRDAGRYERERGTVRTWLLVRLRSRARDRLRAHEELLRASDRRLVLEALAQLDAQQRETLELTYFQGLSASEIADRSGAPIGTVKSRIASGLSRLRGIVRDGCPT